MLKVKKGVMPKRRINFARWMQKHKVSTEVVSVDFGIMRGIESMHR